MSDSIKSKAVKGMAWTGLERFASQAIQFVIGIIIARILMPSDYGIIGMLAIFLAIAQTFLDSGFANALIQKKDRTDVDYSTVFYFNIVVSLILYVLFYVCAPYIASFYEMPVLKDVSRIVSLSLVINSLTIVQTAKLTIDLNFKLQSIAAIVSVIVSGIVGIVMAYNGCGVWALAFQGIVSAGVRAVVLWLFSHWRPLWVFSSESFKGLFSFGSKILCSGMINTIYQNIYTLVIGKYFNASDVGFFNRGNQFVQLPSEIVTQMVVKVNFPILSQYQDDNEKLIHTYKKLLRFPVFILYPILFGIMATASPMVEVLLGEKWLPCVPILQILCLGYMWSPLTHINLNLLYVKGRSDLVLKLELIKKPIAFIILIASIPFGILGMCAGRALYFFVAFAINCHYTNKILHYSFFLQFKEIFPIIINVIVMGAIITLAMIIVDSALYKLIIAITSGITSFIVYALLTGDESYREMFGILQKKILKIF